MLSEVFGGLFAKSFLNDVGILFAYSYDALVSSAAMHHGHLKCNSLPEMIRAVRKGRVPFSVYDGKIT